LRAICAHADVRPILAHFANWSTDMAAIGNTGESTISPSINNAGTSPAIDIERRPLAIQGDLLAFARYFACTKICFIRARRFSNGSPMGTL
jgi:hypothetical protein